MTDVLIDLGEVPQERATLPVPRPPTPYRALLGALSLLLVALLAGAAARHPPRPPVIVPARLGDVTYVAGDRLFLVAGAEPTKVIARYALPAARLLDRTTVTVPGTVSQVVEAGNSLLVAYRDEADDASGTVAVALGTATERWRRPGFLVAASAATGIALLSTGYGTDTPPQRSAVDLTTGAVRWTLSQPADGYTTQAGDRDGYPRWLVTARAGGRLELRDARTATLLATADGLAPDLKSSAVVWPLGEHVLVDAGRGGVTEYALPALTAVWRSDADLSQSWLQSDCGPVICVLRPQRGLTALDAATGRRLWDSDRWTYAEPLGRYLVAAPDDDALDDPRLWLLDPYTGRVLGNFGRWDALPTTGAGSLRYAVRQPPGQYVIFYGILDPDGLTVDVLGSADRVSGDCQTSAGAVICRLVDASIAVYPLR